MTRLNDIMNILPESFLHSANKFLVNPISNGFNLAWRRFIDNLFKENVCRKSFLTPKNANQAIELIELLEEANQPVSRNLHDLSNLHRDLHRWT